MSTASSKGIANSCTQLRRKLVTHSTYNMSTGVTTPGKQEWVTENCNVPLFGDDRKTGICSSCAKGWTHPNNYPVQA